MQMQSTFGSTCFGNLSTIALRKNMSYFLEYVSGEKKEPKPKLLVRILSGAVGVFHVKGWGKNVRSVCPLKPGKPNFFFPGHPGILPGYLHTPLVAAQFNLGENLFAFLSSRAPKICVSERRQGYISGVRLGVPLGVPCGCLSLFEDESHFKV